MLKKIIFYFVFFIIFPISFFGILEVGFRIGNKLYPGKIVTYFDDCLKDEKVYPLPPKTKDEYRIFMFGSSAARGMPQPNDSITNWMKKEFPYLLPKRKISIFNLAWPGKASHHVLRGVEYVLPLKPDLVIIYSGNNEYLTSNRLLIDFWYYNLDCFLYYKSVFYRYLAKQAEKIRKWIVYGHMGAHEPAWREELFAKRMYKKGEYDESEVQKIEDRYKANIEGILRLSRKNGFDVVLLTVPVNMLGHAPGKSLHKPSLTEKELQEWESSFTIGKKMEKDGNLDSAIVHYQKCLSIDPMYGEVYFRLGRTYDLKGDYVSAKKAYEEAADYDRLRSGAMPRLNNLIRQLARQHPEIILVDVVEFLEKKESHHILSGDFFYDDVHPYGYVHKMIAEQILRALALRNKIEKSTQWRWNFLENAMAEDPKKWKAIGDEKSPTKFFWRGMYAWEMRRYNEAIVNLEEGLEKDPSFKEAYGFLGEAHMHLGDKKKACRAFDKLKEDENIFQNVITQYPEIKESIENSLTETRVESSSKS